MMDWKVTDSAMEQTRLRMQQLYEQDLYRQALDVGEQAWGPFRQWRDPEARLLASRIVNQLGLYRTSIAIVFTTWRRHSDLPSVRYAWVRALFNHRGPFAAMQEHDRIGPFLCVDMSLQANWVAFRGTIYSAYRDWDRARAAIEDASTLVENRSEYDYERSWILHEQDRYAEALALIEPHAMRPGRYQRLAMQRTASLYQLLERTQDAIVLLRDGMARFESVNMGMQLHELLTDCERLEEAETLLEQVQSLIPAGETYIGENIRTARFELAYRRGNYPAAIAVLDGVRGRYFRKIRDNLAANHASGQQRQLNVPFIRQHHMTCAPATFAAVSRFHGSPVDHLELAAAICYDGTPALAERRWVAGNGWAVREFELNLTDIATLIDADCPVGFVTVEPGSAHMQAIIGYDTRRGVYLLRDPFLPRVQDILIEGAHAAYASSGPRCMVFVPPERAEWLEQLPLRHADLYDDYFRLQAALDSNNRESAVKAAEALERASPGHRLALWGRRSLADYDNDLVTSLSIVDQLLERYPDDLNLLVSRARLLGDLGKQRERLVFLEDCHGRGIKHSYLLQALADQLAQDHRRQLETQRLLAATLKRQPTSASALWTLAGVHWDTGERTQAFEYYRLCVCVEEKVERYADSFFRAARFLQQTDAALRHLERRVELLGERSPNPYITLARSLDALGRTHESRAVLETALTLHPRDEWLLTEAFDTLLASGDDIGADALLDRNGDSLPLAVRQQKRAVIAEFRGAHEQQLALYGEILALQPQNHRAIVGTTALLANRQSSQAAIEFIDRYLDASPFNCWLMREKLEQVERLPYALQSPHLETMSEHHADDIYLLSARARMLLASGNTEAALVLTSKAISIDSDESWLHFRHARALLAAGNTEAAREAFRQTIRLRVDADDVFEALLSTYPTFEGKREALAYIHGELMRQVSFGNGILEFQQMARRYLEDANVTQFLQEAVRLRPDLWQSWIALACFRLDINRPRDALEAADQAVSRFPLIPRVWLERANVYRVLNEIDSAIQDLQQALSINPRYANCSTHLVDLLELQGNLDEALAELDRAQRLSPRHGPFFGYRAALLWRRGERPQAIDIIIEGLRVAPFYDWAWGTLVEWALICGCQDRARSLGHELAELHPDSGALWKRCAEVVESHEEKAALLDKALACDMHNIDFLKARCGLLVDAGDITAARALLDRNFSGSEKPSEILSYEAWLISCTGRRQDAIRAMEQVLATDPANYSGWRNLARWHDEEGQRDECLRAARMLVQLYPQSSVALTTAAEYFIAHAGAEKSLVAEAREYLERALRLQHGDVNTFLTLVDLYFEDHNHAAIQALFERQLMDEQDVYVRARWVRLLLATGQYDAALDAAASLFADAPDNDWLLFEPYDWFNAAGQDKELRARLHLMARDASMSVRVGRLWMRALVDEANKKPQAFIKKYRATLDTMPDPLRLEGVAWLIGQRNNYPELVTALLYQCARRLEHEPAVWPILVYTAVSANNFDEVCRLSAFAGADAPARALYFCSVGWRRYRHLAQAQEFAARAAACPEDDSRDNLRFWKEFDHWCRDPAMVDLDALNSINLRELTGVEKFLRDILAILCSLPADPYAIDLRELRIAILRAKQAHTTSPAHSVAQQSMVTVWRTLCRRTYGSWLRRMLRCASLLYALAMWQWL